MKKTRQRKAFTIVEMSIVIAVIAILAAVAIPVVGGIIQRAKISSDQNTAANLSVQLALWEVDNGAIENEDDLNKAIRKYFNYDEAKVKDALTPESAKYGYSFLYNWVEKKVVLEKTDELDDVVFGEGTALINDVIFQLANDDDSVSPVVIKNITTTPRSYKIGGVKHTILDQGGSKMGEMIYALETLNDPDDYAAIVSEIETLSENDSSIGLLFNKIKDTALFVKDYIFKYGTEEAKYIAFSPVVEEFNYGAIYEFVDGSADESKTDTIVSGENARIDLPSDVKVNIGAITRFHQADEENNPLRKGTTELHVNATVDELKAIFQAGATDCVIVLPGGSRYIIDGDKIVKLDEGGNHETVGEELETPTIEKIEIQYNDEDTTAGADGDYFYSTNKTLYLAYDFNDARLSLKDIPASMVNWTVSEDAPIEVSNSGKITVIGEPNVENTIATVTATFKGNEEITDNITVQLIFPTSVNWTLDSAEYSSPTINNTITITYTDKTDFELVASGVGYNQSGYVKMDATDLKFDYSEDGDLLKKENGKLVLDPDEIETNPTQTLTVTYGNDTTTYVSQTYTVTVIDNSSTPFEKNVIVDNACADSNCTDKDNCSHNDLLMGDTYLFRVGNGNKFRLDALFNVDEAPKNIKLTIRDASKWNNETKAYDEINLKTGDLDADYTSSLTDDTWASSTIQFSGTGVAIIRIENGVTNDFKELAVEVVDANNVTTYSELKGNVNSVLLNNITMTSNGNFDLSAGKFIYGNGFTFDITNGATAASTRFGIISLGSGAILDNTVVVGATFPQLGNSYNKDAYYVAAVYLNGGTISNSYISGCRTPVTSAGGAIINTTLHGGKYANLYCKSDTTTIEDLTTINQPGAIDGTSSGLGIVLDSIAILEINGDLTQYNWINSSEKSYASGNDYAGVLFDIIFANKDEVKHIQFAYDEKTWVNAGIFRLTNTTSIIGNVPGYGTVSASYSMLGEKFTGYAYTCSSANGYAFSGRTTPADYVPTKQGAHAPTVTWSNDAYKDGKHEIKFDEGQSYEFDPNVLTAKHYGNSLVVNVKMDGVDYTRKKITFNDTETTTHTIVYSYSAKPCYDKDGKEINDTVLFEQKLEVKVTVAKKVGAPTFTFYYGTNGNASAGSPRVTQPSNSYTSTVVKDGNTYYIMPNASATSANAIGSKTINGKTIYYPIVDGINVRSGGSTDYDFLRYYPIFKAVSISDNGKSYSYSGTKEMPAAVSWVSAEIDSGNSSSGLNDGTGLYNNQYLCKYQKQKGNTEGGGTAIVKFSYVAEDGNTYYYYVGYRFYDEDEGGTCVTGDTLVTLADGTQVRVDSLTGNELLRVWDHTTGTITYAPIAYIVNHDETISEHNVLKMAFSDGNYLEIIGEHVFYDKTLNKYVAITADNVDEYIGHVFVSNEGNGLKEVTLVGAENIVRNTGVYEVVTYKAITCFTNGILSASAYLDPLLNVFDMDADSLVYDEAKMMEDIATYGLYTYEDFEGLVPEEAFEMYNAAYLKIAVGKGYITWDNILELIDIYYNNDVTPLK